MLTMNGFIVSPPLYRFLFPTATRIVSILIGYTPFTIRFGAKILIFNMGSRQCRSFLLQNHGKYLDLDNKYP